MYNTSIIFSILRNSIINPIQSNLFNFFKLINIYLNVYFQNEKTKFGGKKLWIIDNSNKTECDKTLMKQKTYCVVSKCLDEFNVK